jgi:hypothetical protein
VQQQPQQPQQPQPPPPQQQPQQLRHNQHNSQSIQEHQPLPTTSNQIGPHQHQQDLDQGLHLVTSHTQELSLEAGSCNPGLVQERQQHDEQVTLLREQLRAAEETIVLLNIRTQRLEGFTSLFTRASLPFTPLTTLHPSQERSERAMTAPATLNARFSQTLIAVIAPQYSNSVWQLHEQRKEHNAAISQMQQQLQVQRCVWFCVCVYLQIARLPGLTPSRHCAGLHHRGRHCAQVPGCVSHSPPFMRTFPYELNHQMESAAEDAAIMQKSHAEALAHMTVGARD